MGKYTDRPGSMTGKVTKTKEKRAADEAALLARRDAGTLTTKDKQNFLMKKALKKSGTMDKEHAAVAKKVDEGLAHEQRLDIGDTRRQATQRNYDAEMGLSVNADGTRANPWRRHAPVAEAAPAAPVRYSTGLLPGGQTVGQPGVAAAPMRAPGGPPPMVGPGGMATGEQVAGGRPMKIARAIVAAGGQGRPGAIARAMLGAPQAGAPGVPMQAAVRPGVPAAPMMGRRGSMAVPGTPAGPGVMAGYQGASAAPAVGRMGNPQRQINQGEFSGVSVSPKGGRRR